MAGKPSRTYIPLYPVPPLPVEEVKPEDSIWMKIAKSDDSSMESDDSFIEPTDPRRNRQGKPVPRKNKNKLPPKVQAWGGGHANSQALSPPGKDKVHSVGSVAGMQ